MKRKTPNHCTPRNNQPLKVKLIRLVLLALPFTLFIQSCQNTPTKTIQPEDVNFKWEAKDPILDAFMFDEEDWIAIKDPSIVQHEGQWHLFCTLRGKERSHAMVYTAFDDFENAA
ncbi:MAG: hypothetical protein AAGI23_23005, partial [Bacteroidota bacterium]